MIQALRSALNTTGLTCTGFTTSNFFHERIKEGSAFPYTVYKSLPSTVSRDSATDFENNEIQFVISSDVCTEVETKATALKTVFDYGKDNLSVSGYTVVECVRTLEIGPSHLDETNIWTYILQYRITISTSR